jgi:DNA-binding response OmpR family regulator
VKPTGRIADNILRRRLPMRVLVVDDEPDVLLLCRVNFEFAGHEVLEADDAEAAITMATSEQPDLIVLDVMLPNRDGLSVLRQLNDQPETKQVPVVLLTAKTQEHDRLDGYEAGAAAIHSMTPAERQRRRDVALAQLSNHG